MIFFPGRCIKKNIFLRDDTKSCEKISILNSFKIRWREGFDWVVKFTIANFIIIIHLMWEIWV